ncbi:MAG TPA: hypothetical protein ENI13_00890 [candidate division CPR3 bacterium]|uniref:Uncharacterized protein n=1 Tax=candidate division CPR3 bacterium TaxID=2268181 RepID=A0A7C1SMW3_UNCC3|nr:hypothetical protein [candidate division CPR3 bacterium]
MTVICETCHQPNQGGEGIEHHKECDEREDGIKNELEEAREELEDLKGEVEDAAHYVKLERDFLVKLIGIENIHVLKDKLENYKPEYENIGEWGGIVEVVSEIINNIDIEGYLVSKLDVDEIRIEQMD